MIDNVKSDEFNMNIGTPQGSVLRSHIFLLFINDLSTNNSQVRVFMYADDTIIVTPENIYIFTLKSLLSSKNFLSGVRKINL